MEGFDYEHEPIAIIEGGKGLNDTERLIEKRCQDRNIEHYVLDGLYENPRKVMAIMYLKPKTIVFGTTGTYREDVEHLIALLKIGEHIPDIICISIGEELGVIRDALLYAKSKNENLKAFTVFIDWNDEFVFNEIELK